MKHNKKSKMDKIRHAFATLLACTVVLGVPALTILQFWHPHSDHRKATPLPALQVRAVDNTTAVPKIFQQPLISVTFDDGWETTYQDALPILQKHGIRTTQYILSGVENNPSYLSWDQVRAIQKAGHEIGCHTITHPDLTTVSSQEVMRQLTGCKTTMEKEVGKPVTDFASPYGAENASTLKEIKTVFASQRNVYGDSSNGVSDVDVNLAANFNPNDIIGMTVKRDTSPKEIQELIDFTVKNNGWLVLTYHQADDGPSKYGLDTHQLDEEMTILEHAPARIVTVNQAISSWQARK